MAWIVTFTIVKIVCNFKILMLKPTVPLLQIIQACEKYCAQLSIKQEKNSRGSHVNEISLCCSTLPLRCCFHTRVLSRYVSGCRLRPLCAITTCEVGQTISILYTVTVYFSNTLRTGRIPAFDWDGKSTKDNEGYEQFPHYRAQVEEVNCE